MLALRCIGLAASLAAAELLACQGGGGPGTDGGEDAFDALAEGQAPDARSGADGGEPSEASGGEPGSIAFLVSDVEWIEDRLCDVDGDGLEDNAVADLGSPLSHVFAMTINTAMVGAIQEGQDRICAHFPHLDDREAPSSPAAPMIFFEGVDTDSPPDSTDDFSGEEPFYAKRRSLDGCGEPRFFFPRARLDAGALRAEHGLVPVRLSSDFVVLDVTVLEGTVAPGGSDAELTSCGHVTFREAGSVGTPAELGDRTALEAVLAGGAAMGMDTVPGLSPDLDLDGDGLEGFVLDEDYHIESCLDGDRTTIAGRDCWQDDRMADGFSVTMRFAAMSALFAGREPGWDDDLESTCPGGLPEESLFYAP